MYLFSPPLISPILGKNGRRDSEWENGLANLHEPTRPNMGFYPTFMGCLTIHGEW